jgi:PAS domain S-box-containing protein
MEASSIMETANIRRLVVLDKGRSVGIITQTDMVRALASYTLTKEISEIMTNDVAVIASSASVRAAAELMASKDISCLVATNDGAVVGVFTERDLLKRVIAVKRNPDQTRLKQIMSSPVVSISREQSVLSAMKMLESIGIRRLVVMDGETLYGLVTQTDILKAIKADLQEEEENYLRLLSESSNCIFMVDPNLSTTYANPAFMKLLDVTDPDELINKPFLPERFWDNPRERQWLLAQLQRASVEVRELTLRTAKGQRLFVTLFLTHSKNIRGDISGSQGVLYDVTATKELAALRETQEQLQNGQSPLTTNPDCAGDGILVVDDKGRVSNINRRFAQIWGIPEELTQEQDSEKLAECLVSRLDELQPFFARMQASCLTQQENGRTLHLKDGRVLNVYSLRLARGKTSSGRIWSFRDITGSCN